MTNYERKLIVRKWGFWYEGGLAVAGVALQSAGNRICVRLTETVCYVIAAPLPTRLHLERLIRERVRRDINEILGPDCKASIRFDPMIRDEHCLAVEVFGALANQGFPGS